MMPLPFSLELKNRLPEASWPWLLAALRQDHWIWSALETTGLGRRRLEALPPDPAEWRPAALGLLALESAVGSQELASAPAGLADEELRARAEQAYQAWLTSDQETADPGQKPVAPDQTLASCALIALALREQLLQAAPWQGLLSTLHLERREARLILACLYGLMPEPGRLLEALLKHGPTGADLAVEVVLRQPLAPADQAPLFMALLEGLDQAHSLDLLSKLGAQRPGLVLDLAGDLLQASDAACVQELQEDRSQELSYRFDRLAGAVRLSDCYRVAGQPDRAVPLLAETLRLARRLRGHLSARLAEVMDTAEDAADEAWRETARETSLEAWKQAVQLAPDEPRFIAGLAHSLLGHNRLPEAQAYLAGRQADGETDPSISLASGLLCERSDEPEAARRHALQALRLVESGEALSRRDLGALARLFEQLDLPAEAARVIEAALAHHPLEAGLLARLAKLQLSLGQASQALASAFAAQAAGGADDPALAPLIVTALETVGAWANALDYRLAELRTIETPTLADLHAVIRCAEYAGQNDLLAEFSSQAMLLDPEDVLAQRGLAQAALSAGDYPRAIDFLSSATDLAPEQPGLWLLLVEAYRRAGQVEKADETLRTADQAVPGDAAIQTALGEVYLAQGAPTQALSYFRGAAEIAPTQHNALRLGQTLLQLGHVSQACQVLGEAYQAAALPERVGPATLPDTELTFSFARALQAARQIEPAIPLMLAVVRAHPDDPEAQLELARLLMYSADQPANARRAIALLQRVLGLSLDGAEGGYDGRLDAMPGLRSEARALLAEAYSADGEWDLAMQAYQRALDDPLNRLAERQTRLSAGLGLVALRLEQPEMAVASLEEAARAEPANIQVLCALSEAYLASALAPDAYETALKVRRLAPDDLQASLWFIEQGSKLASQPGINTPQIRAEILQAMKASTLLAPQRADLQLRLGRLLADENDPAGALQAFHCMAEADSASQTLTPAQHYQIAQIARRLGDAPLAVQLLESAIALSSQGEAGNPPPILADLLAELSLAQQQAGSPELALQAVDQALGVDEDRAMLHAQKADLLQQAGQVDEALESLRSAVRLSPRNADLRLRMAGLLSQRNDLPGALEQAEKGLAALADAPAEDENHDLARSLNREAAALAFATLRSHRALEYLSALAEPDDQAGQDFSEAALRAELSLETSNLQTAAQAVEKLKRMAPDHPRAHAAAARLAHRLRDEDERDRACRGAIRTLVQLQLNQQPVAPPSTKAEFIASYLSTAQAALDNCQWEAALETLDRLIEALPETPAAHYLRATALARRGEAQLLFQDLDVASRALGEAVLSAEAQQAFDLSLAEAQRLLATGVELEATGELKPWQDECSQKLAVCLARGRALFQPSLQGALVMQSLLQGMTPNATEVAALVMAFRRCGEPRGAFQAAQVGWRPVFEGDDVCTHPLVLAQVALAEQEVQPALAKAQDALTFAEKQGDGWPALPMLHYLLARTACLAQAYPLAMSAIQNALADWPDEPRWQTLAAQIYLAQAGEAGLPDHARALAHLEQAASLDPGCAANHLALGQLYLEDGQAARAVQSIQQASELDGAQPKVWIALAQAQFAADELEQAAISAERAIENNPAPEEALLLRGRIALQTNNPRGALSRAQAILRDSPDHPEAIYLLSQALEAMDRPAEALVALERALALSAHPFPLQIERVQLLRRSKGLEAGVASLQELVAHNPQQPVLLAMLAEWLNEAGRPEAALQAARLALQEEQGQLSEEQRAGLHILIGLRMCRLGQLDQAIHHLSEAVEGAPANLEAYLELGRAYQERREYRQALKVYQRALSVAKDDYRPYYQAGLVLKDSKDYVAAEAMLRRAAQLAPAEVSVHRLLGAVVALNLVHNRRLTPAGH